MRETGATRDLWMHLLLAGEFKLSTEIRQELPDLQVSSLRATLFAMSESGQLSTRKLGTRVFYGVTNKSRIPKGITIGELTLAVKSLEG